MLLGLGFLTIYALNVRPCCIGDLSSLLRVGDVHH